MSFNVGRASHFKRGISFNDKAGVFNEDTSTPMGQSAVKGVVVLDTSEAEALAWLKYGNGDNDWTKFVTERSLRIGYDAIVAPAGQAGHYTSVAAAYTAGHKTVFVRKSTYTETADVVIPDGGQLICEKGTIIDFNNASYHILCSSGISPETAGTVSVNSGSTIVNGVGTSFTNLSPGDYILLGSAYVEIDTIPTDLLLNIKYNWKGDNISGQSMYSRPMYTGVKIENVTVINSVLEAVLIRGVVGLKLENVDVSNSSDNGIEIRDCCNFSLSHCAMRNTGANGFNIVDSHSGSIDDNCYAENCTTGGFRFAESSAIRVVSAISHSNGTSGYNIRATCADLTLNMCHSLFNDGDGVEVVDGAVRISLIGCTINSNDNKGCDVGAGVKIRGCTITNNASQGIDGTGANLEIVNNTIGTNETNGITLSAACNNSVICNNHITGTSDYGIEIDGADNCVIAGNYIQGHLVDEINIASGSTGNVLYGNFADDIVDNGTNTVMDQPPQLTTTQRGQINAPKAGFIVNDTTLGYPVIYYGGAWVPLSILNGVSADPYHYHDPAYSPENIIGNPSFEAGTGISADGWTQHSSYTRVNDRSNIGTWSMKHTGNGSVQTLNCTISVQPYTRYRIKIWFYKKTGEVPATSALDLNDSDGEFTINTSNSVLDQWQTAETYYDSREHTSLTLRILTNMTTSHEMWWDDISLTPIGAGASARRYYFQPDQMEPCNVNDWAVNNPVGVIADGDDFAVKVARFRNTESEAIGFTVPVHENSNAMVMRVEVKNANGGGGTGGNFVFQLYMRQKAHNGTWSAWTSALTVGVITLPSSLAWQVVNLESDTFGKINFDDFSSTLVAGNKAQFCLVRDHDNGSNTFSYNVKFAGVEVFFTNTGDL